MKKTIWGNTLVKNEGRYIWFSLMSVIDHLDKIIVWDTGSTDETVTIIKEVAKLEKGKIEFKEIGNVNETEFTKARQEMLDSSNCDWIFILDGDEVWWNESIKKVVKTINEKGNDLDLIVTPYYSVVGDIYHYQEQEAGKYNLAGRRGHLNIRAVNRKIPRLFVDKPYGQEGFFDAEGNKIQDRDSKKILFIDAPYLHFSNIKRSSINNGDSAVMQRRRKIRYEIGKKFPPNFKYPEVLYSKTPGFVNSPWGKMQFPFKIRAIIETPFRKIKRKLNG